MGERIIPSKSQVERVARGVQIITESLSVELDSRAAVIFRGEPHFDMTKGNAVRLRGGNKFCGNGWGPSGMLRGISREGVV